VSAAKAGIIGCPILASLFEREAGLLQGSSKVIREIDAPSATPSLHHGDPFSARSSLRPARHHAASHQDVPHRGKPLGSSLNIQHL